MLRKLLLLVSAVSAITINKQMPYDDGMVYGEVANLKDMSRMTEHDFNVEHEEEMETRAEQEREKNMPAEEQAEFAAEDEDVDMNGFEHIPHIHDADQDSPDVGMD